MGWGEAVVLAAGEGERAGNLARFVGGGLLVVVVLALIIGGIGASVAGFLTLTFLILDSATGKVAVGLALPGLVAASYIYAAPVLLIPAAVLGLMVVIYWMD